MELLKELTEKDLNLNSSLCEKYKVRKATRSIVFNDLGQIALLYVSKNNYHKLPGGGIEEGEDIQAALEREVLEEVGAKIDVLGEIGLTIEYRNQHELIQISYCFYSKMVGELKETSFTQQELDNGFVLKWIDFDKAVEVLEKDEPNNYVGKFICERDLVFLKKAVEKTIN